MIMWLWRAIVGCNGCRYVEVETGRLLQKGGPYGKFWVLRCEKCGHMKSFKFEA